MSLTQVRGAKRLKALHVGQSRWPFISRVIAGDYQRNILTILTGSAASQALPIVLAPVVTRLYGPADYGVLGVYMSVVAMGAVLTTSQYTQAIMLPRKRADVVNLLALSASLAGTIALVTGALVTVAPDVVMHSLSLGGYAACLYLAPLSVLFAGVTAGLGAWHARHRHYSQISASRILAAVATSVVQLTVGFIHPNALGLVGAYMTGAAAGMLYLCYAFWRDEWKCVRLLSVRRMRKLASERRDFVLFVLPADVMNVVTNQWPILLLSRLAGAASVGYYALTQRVAGLPASLLGTAVVEVFRQRAIAEYNESGHCRQAFVSTFRILVGLGVIPCLTLLVFGPRLFVFAFGSRWLMAGEYSRVLSVLLFLRFVASPLTYVYYVAGRQREDAVLHIVMIATTVAAMWAGYQLFHSGLGVVGMFAVNYSLIYVVYLWRSYVFATRGDHKEIPGPVAPAQSSVA